MKNNSKKFSKPLPYLVQGNSYPINKQVKVLRGKIKPLMQRRLPTVYYAGFSHSFVINYIKKTKKTHPYFLKFDIQKFYPSLQHQTFIVEVQLAYKLLLGARAVPKSFKEQVFPLFTAFFQGLPGHSGIPLGNSFSATFAPLVFVPMLLQLKKQEVPFIVFVDDFLLFFKTKKEMETTYWFIKESLSSLQLDINPAKTKSGLFATEKFAFLGWEIKGGYYVVSQEKQEKFKDKIASMLADNKRTALRLKIKQLNNAINGFGHYYKYGNVSKQFIALDSYIRKHLRAWLKRNAFPYVNNAKIGALGLRSLQQLHKNIKQPIPTKNSYKKIIKSTLGKPKDQSKPNLVYIEELLEKLVAQNTQLIHLLDKQGKLLQHLLGF